MKFCKALQKVAEASDPSYRPYWTDYKRLKKLIKAIVINDVQDEKLATAAVVMRTSKTAASPPLAFQSSKRQPLHQNRTNLKPQQSSRLPTGEPTSIFTKGGSHGMKEEIKAQLQQNPCEVAFFQLLHSELGKASEFFEKTEKQFALREEIVRVGMEVLKRPASRTIKDRWTVLSRAVFILYKDLLLLETFAIMTYFAFSKILKKHDKVTGHETREPFMVHVVNKANFTNYPKIMEMIRNCQLIYNDASQRLVQGIMMQEEQQLFLQCVNQMQQTTQQHQAAHAAAALAPPRAGAASEASLDSKPAALTHAELLERGRLSHLPVASSTSACSTSAVPQQQAASGQEEKRIEYAEQDSWTETDQHRPYKKRRVRGDSAGKPPPAKT